MMEYIPGFAALARRYDGFIVDLWGVIHDGAAPYPGVRECLARLAAAGKPCVFLSNAPRRAKTVAAALSAIGIGPELYRGIMTSGEAIHAALKAPPDAWFAALGPRLFHLGPERDRGLLSGLSQLRVETPEEANFVLNTGPDDALAAAELTVFEPLLTACRNSRLPMICANPDREVIRAGQRVWCAGALALRYRDLGGEVRQFGKPDPAIYRFVLTLLGLPRERVLVVGDSLTTDIAGAAAAGIDSCFVLGGLHDLAGRAEEAALTAHAAGFHPVAAINAFRWG